MSTWITEHLTETDERIPASALAFEAYLDDEPMLVGDAVSDEEWEALSSMREDDGDEDPFYDEEGPYFGGVEDAACEYGFYND